MASSSSLQAQYNMMRSQPQAAHIKVAASLAAEDNQLNNKCAILRMQDS